jgi:hypothetical protein
MLSFVGSQTDADDQGLACFNATVVNSSTLVQAIAAVCGIARSLWATHTSTRDVPNPVIKSGYKKLFLLEICLQYWIEND